MKLRPFFLIDEYALVRTYSGREFWKRFITTVREVIDFFCKFCVGLSVNYVHYSCQNR